MNHLHDLVDAVKSGRVLGGEKRVGDTILANEISGLAGVSVCFNMGDAHEWGGFRIIPELFRLPFQTIYVEAELLDGLLGVFAWTCESCPDLHLAVLNKYDWSRWAILGMATVHDIGKRPDALFSVTSHNDPDGENSEYFRDTASLLAKFLAALHCSNTKSVEHRAPKLINKQRAKKGKTPIYSYWTLHLPGGEVGAETTGAGGTHASPRVHLRRGHPRQYADGKWTWVQPCIVGNKALGVVHKDYEFRKNSEKAENSETEGGAK